MPIPDPVAAAAPRTKRSKIRSRSSRSIPGPWSRTRMTACPSSAPVESSIGASRGLYATAFLRRLSKIWSRRGGSASTMSGAVGAFTVTWRPGSSASTRRPAAWVAATTSNGSGSTLNSATLVEMSWRSSASRVRRLTCRVASSRESGTRSRMSSRATYRDASCRWPESDASGLRSSWLTVAIKALRSCSSCSRRRRLSSVRRKAARAAAPRAATTRPSKKKPMTSRPLALRAMANPAGGAK